MPFGFRSGTDAARLLRPLPRSFYLRPTLAVARDLPGKYLVRRSGKSLLVVRIVEVEAYLGARDPASHAFRGRTPRNDVMFWEGGHLYVYFTYGMHFCCNVVTEEEGRGMAVLIRAGEPVAGTKVMMRRRGTSGMTQLCSGPARLCQALGIGRNENGTDLCGGEIWIAGGPASSDLYAGRHQGRKHRGGKTDTDSSRRRESNDEASLTRGTGPGDAQRGGTRLGRSTRIGIREGTGHRWRFYVRGDPHVSKARPSGPDGRNLSPDMPGHTRRRWVSREQKG